MKNTKHFFKRGISLAMALVMCLSLLPTTAFAVEYDGTCPKTKRGHKIRTESGTTYCPDCGSIYVAFAGWEVGTGCYNTKIGHNADNDICGKWEDVPGSVATCTQAKQKQRTCIWCGVEVTKDVGSKNPANHTGTISDWTVKDGKHVKAYDCCGLVVEQHEIPEGTCAGGTCGINNCELPKTVSTTHTGDTRWVIEDGQHVRYCTTCNAATGEAHDIPEGVCTGETDCPDCDQKVPVDLTKHNYPVEGNYTAPTTCGERGYTTYVCENGCGVKKVDYDDTAKTHTLIPHEPKAATCIATGNEKYWSCATCGKLFSDANGETETTQEKVTIKTDPDNHVNGCTLSTTCTNGGDQHYQEYSTCGAKVYSDHNYGTYTWVETTEKWVGTCVCGAIDEQTVIEHKCEWKTVFGVTYHWQTCTFNGCDKIKGKVEHTYDVEGAVTKNPTCVAAGEQTWKCVCGAETTKSVDPTDHTPAEAVVENEVKATCRDKGSYDVVVYCSVCKAQISRETKTIEIVPTNHSYGAWEKVSDATCKAPERQKRTCSLCRNVEQRDVGGVNPKNHADEAAQPFNYNDAKNHKLYWACCGTFDQTTSHFTDTKDTTVAHMFVGGKCACGYQCQHPESTRQYVEPGTANWSEDNCQYQCTTCNAQVSEPHDKSGTWLSGTDMLCKDVPFTQHQTCPKCNQRLSNPAKGTREHDWGNWVMTKEPTATEAGEVTGTCRHINVLDGNVREACTKTTTISLPALGTIDENWTCTVTEPTCTKPGTATYTYTNDTVVTVTIEATSHSYGEWTKNEDGSFTRDCVRGDDTQTWNPDEHDGQVAPEHDCAEHAVVVDAVAPTCTETGLTEGSKCDWCDATLVAQNAIPAAGHTYGAWFNRVTPTETTEGEDIRLCVVCAHADYRIVDALGTGEVEIDENNTPLAGLPFDLDPQEELTRAHLIYVLYWFEGEPDAAACTFTDVSDEAYYYEALGWAEENGIAVAYPDGTFKPDETVTRGDMETFLNLYNQYLGVDEEIYLGSDRDHKMLWGEAEIILNDFFSITLEV